MHMQEFIEPWLRTEDIFEEKTVSMKSVHDVEDSFSNRSINCPYLLPEMYVFTLVRKRGVIFTLYNVY